MRTRIKQPKNTYGISKRGETIIEAMFAFAIFSFVAVITVSLMNSGIASGERSLELVTARNELNAQAEALRFIHSSYISEKSLPETCEPDPITGAETTNCQQFKDLWEDVTGSANYADSVSIEYPLSDCNEAYDRGLLASNNAFILNTRQLLGGSNRNGSYSDNDALIRASDGRFRRANLNARIIYTYDGSYDENDDQNSVDQITAGRVSLADYRRVASVEGIWIIPVRGENGPSGAPQYWDFYVQTCWYGSDLPAPSSLDTIVRLYNPDGV